MKSMLMLLVAAALMLSVIALGQDNASTGSYQCSLKKS